MMGSTSRRTRRIVILALLVLGISGAAVMLLRTSTSLPGLAELVATGGEKQLRDPMRPPGRAATRVLVLALDGVGADELDRAIAAGGMPHLSAVLHGTGAIVSPGDAAARELYPHAYAARDALSILPSTTYAAWASVFTGRPAGETGVAGNEWFDREEVRFYAPAPVSVKGTEHAVAVYADDFIGGVLAVPTLYERADVRAYVSLSMVHRGADLLTIPDLGAVADLAGALAAGLTDDGEAMEMETFRTLDESAAESLLETLRAHGVPDLLTVYFPGVDLYTHVAEPALPEQHRYLREVVDPAIGRLLAEYRRQGAADDLWVVVVSDHGHTPVLDDDRHALGTDAEGDGEPPELLRRIGFRVRPFELEVDEDGADFQAVLAYQGAMAYVYLADRSGCPEPGTRCDWSRPPRHAEDVLAVAEAFRRASDHGALVPTLRGALDLVLVRPPQRPGEPPGPYQVYEGGRLVPIPAWLAANPRPDLLDLDRRIQALATGPHGARAGDVLLLTRSGLERPLEQRYYFSGLYKSWHGSPTAQDSRIAFVVANPGVPGEEIRQRVRAVAGDRVDQLDVAAVVLRLLGVDGN
jgi:hypothetical protein